jgi:hypothetical protein
MSLQAMARQWGESRRRAPRSISKTRQRRAESAHALNRTARCVWVPPTQTALHGLPGRVGYTLISPLRRASPVLSAPTKP